MTIACIMHSQFCSPTGTFCWGLLSGPGDNDDIGKIGIEKSELLIMEGLLLDVVSIISFLVVGILGATSVLHLSPAASYSMIGISAGILLADASIYIGAYVMQARERSGTNTLVRIDMKQDSSD